MWLFLSFYRKLREDGVLGLHSRDTISCTVFLRCMSARVRDLECLTLATYDLSRANSMETTSLSGPSQLS